MEVEHSKWPSFSNIHKVALHPDFFEKVFSFGEKIDGSNLGIQVNVTTRDAYLHGRNTLVPYDFSKPASVKYGNAGSLGTLPVLMKEFALKLCEHLQLEEVVVYGEAYRHGMQKNASFHPFGYKVGEKLHGLTVATRASFAHCALESDAAEFGEFRTHADYTDALERSQRHIVFPPIIYRTCTLAEGIESLHEEMKSPSSPKFEGCFCVCEDESVTIRNSDCNLAAFKWKTGTHEEQAGMPSLERLSLSEPAHLVLHDKLSSVFNSRPFAGASSKPSKTAPSSSADSAKKAADADVRLRIKTAFERELGKMVSFAEVPKKERAPIAATIKPLILAEVLRGYEEDSADGGAPLSEAQRSSLSKAVDKLTMGLVMSV